MENQNILDFDKDRKINNGGKMKVKRNVIFGKAGGNASKNAYNYKINIPSGMIKDLGITIEDREVTLECENGIITIKKSRGD